MFLGIDTSNYTTSAALYSVENGITQRKLPLTVAAGERGLRQSDAVFLHTKQLPEVLGGLLPSPEPVMAVAASVSPRSEPGSYMPCFLAGEGMGRSIAAALGVPFVPCSHQQGHVAAAVWGTGRLSLFSMPHLAFHVSGGTTELLSVTPEENGRGYSVSCVGRTLDLAAGQLIDRIGVGLGLPFPAGPALEKLALTADGPRKGRTTLKDGDCCLSGIENLAQAYIDKGDASGAARFVFDSVAETLSGMLSHAIRFLGEQPVLLAGGVMSSRYLTGILSDRFGALAAPPEYSADNAAGVAVYGRLVLEGLWHRPS